MVRRDEGLRQVTVRLGDRLSVRAGVLIGVAFLGTFLAADRLVTHVAPNARLIVFLLGAVAAYVINRSVWKPILERLSTEDDHPS